MRWPHLSLAAVLFALPLALSAPQAQPRRWQWRLPAASRTPPPPPPPPPHNDTGPIILGLLLLQSVILWQLCVTVAKIDPKTLIAICARSAAETSAAGGPSKKATPVWLTRRFSTQVLDSTPLSYLLVEHQDALRALRVAFLEAGGQADPHTDVFLLRFLASSNGHLPHALAWVQRTVAWRAESGMQARRQLVLAGAMLLEEPQVIELIYTYGDLDI